MFRLPKCNQKGVPETMPIKERYASHKNLYGRERNRIFQIHKSLLEIFKDVVQRPSFLLGKVKGNFLHCLQGEAELIFVNAVTAGGSVKIVPAV